MLELRKGAPSGRMIEERGGVSEENMAGKIDKSEFLEEDKFDAIVLGTGITESVAAAALVVAPFCPGCRPLHHLHPEL